MASGDFDVAIVGGGAAGIAAARYLHGAGIAAIIVEARPRLGGRGHTVTKAGIPLDLGCGWLHSADRNPWAKIAERQGHRIDKTPPPWVRPSLSFGFPLAEQREFGAAREAFYDRMNKAAAGGEDSPAARFLEPGNRWNELIDAVSTYISGAELHRQSAIDFERYDDTGVNWRVEEGYGATIAAYGAGLPVALGCAALAIDHSGRRVRVETTKGTFSANQVIVTVPSAILAEEAIRFTPTLPDKIEAAAGLPLGLADKLFLALDGAEEFEAESRLFGRTDCAATGAYHFRPFGRQQIEAYYGGQLAHDLEAGGDAAFFDFAASELTGLLGSAFARRIRPLAIHRWHADPYARGSYSYARPGMADSRGLLAAPVGDRLFFAGEACSPHDFSTAHGAFLTGVAAAERALAERRG